MSVIYTTNRGVATTIDFPMVLANDSDFAGPSDWTPEPGDCKISKDGGNITDTTNLPVAIGGSGSKLWSLTLTADETDAEHIAIQIVDAQPKAVEDQCLILRLTTPPTVAPLASTVSSGEITDTDVTVYVATASPALVWTITDSTGAAVSLSGATVQLQVLTYDGSILFTSSGIVSGASSNIVTCAYSTTNTAISGAYRYELRRIDSGNERVLARGDFLIAERQRE